MTRQLRKRSGETARRQAPASPPAIASLANGKGRAVLGLAPKRRAADVVVGTIVEVEDAGAALVELSASFGNRLEHARSTVRLTEENTGSEAVLMFEGGQIDQPIIVGLLQPNIPVQPDTAKGHPIEVDGDKLTISAEREIVLRCGEASITLTRAGKVIIKGNYVLSRSAGVNVVRGASVQIN